MKTKFLAWVFTPCVVVCLTFCNGSFVAADVIKTNFAISNTNEIMTALWAAKQQGIFRKHGLETQIILMPRNPLSIAALSVGEIDMAIAGLGHLLNASSGGADIVGVANLAQKLDFSLHGRPEVKRPEDLRGKKIGISGPGSTSHIVVLLALQSLGIDPNQAKISLITIPGTELNRRLALESGTVDATSLRGAMGDLYAKKGYPALFNFKGSGVTMPQAMVLTTRRSIANKPEVVEAHLKSIIEGIAFVTEPANKEIVTKLLATNLRLNKPEELEEAYNSVVNTYERVPYPNIDSVKRLHGVLTVINPKLATVRPETVVDNSFVNRLESSGFVSSVFKKR
ncbi:MAG: ABC transporter substrate-binding protein [Deltaproteobacteria bacterium]|nr:ABC transporter substrate-binding protein [Deltaproteobacteria bacterium]